MTDGLDHYESASTVRRCDAYQRLAASQARAEHRRGHVAEAALWDTYADVLECAAKTIRQLLKEKNNGRPTG